MSGGWIRHGQTEVLSRKNPSRIHDVKCVSDQYFFFFFFKAHPAVMSSSAVQKQTDRQKKVAPRVPSSMCSPPCRCDRNNKGTWKKLASGPQADNSPDGSLSTIAGPCKQEHACRFCNMQQSSCNYIPPGVSRLQQSGVFFFCQFWQISPKRAHLGAKPII